MSTKIETLLDAVQSNAYPAMYEDLGKHLGVSAASLTRLGLGWVPIVDFRRGRNYRGWWSIPERDPEGRVIGLSLRGQDDTKASYPSSKRGLVYEINPKYPWGGHYTPGPDNWVRVKDADILCPVCGKPDGCIVSADDPANPRSVGCIRVQSPTRLDDGGLPTWLHVLRVPDMAETALGRDDNPVIVVEGMTDVAAAMDLGFPAVGRPSNLACMDMLRKLLFGREKVIVVGENDRKADGREPGKDGMIAAFHTLRRVCKKVTMMMPPTDVKDLRAWYVRGGLTHEGFLEYHSKHAEEYAEETTLEDDRPLTIARAYLRDEYQMGRRYTLRRWANTWYEYNGMKYVSIDEERFRGPVYQWAHERLVRHTTTKGEVLLPLKANKGLLANLSEAAASEAVITTATLPCWINDQQGPATSDVIVFANGVLDVTKFLNSEADDMLPLTPDLFTTVAIPYAFDPTAICPTWLGFLQSSLGDDPLKIRLLQEWFGYCLTPDTSMQKLMFLRGITGAGKGVIIDTLCSLVGPEQAAEASFASLTGDFGIQPLLDKLVCTMPDARTPRFGDTMRGLELLLNIASGDGIQVNRKFKDIIERRRLTARIIIASNEFLDVSDHAGAMLRRMNIIEFRRSFKDKPDQTLRKRIDAEIPGVAIWALEGLRRLRQQNHFTLPETSKQASKEWRIQTSPLAEFLDQCTLSETDGAVGKMELYEAWDKWSRERHGIRPISLSRFMERVRSNAPYVTVETTEDRDDHSTLFRGVSLRRWAAKRYLGKM